MIENGTVKSTGHTILFAKKDSDRIKGLGILIIIA